MVNNQPEALRLAGYLDAFSSTQMSKAAAELRRLHSLCGELSEKLMVCATDKAGLKTANAELDREIAELRKASESTKPDFWVVLDECGLLHYCASYEGAAHEHINDAINEFDVPGAAKWVVRPVYLAPQTERESVKLCVKLHADLASVKSENANLRRDAERIEWINKRLFVKHWNGVIDGKSATTWFIPADHRHTTQRMIGATFRAAVDAAMKEQA